MMDLFKMIEAHNVCLNELRELPLNIALSTISVLIDELAKIHDINTMEMWDEMREAANDVYQEMGGVDYEV